jgi:carbon storage regulator
VGQGIIIGGNVRIQLVSARGKQVRIGIEAPPSIRVLRAEVSEQRAEKSEAVAEPALAGPVVD